MGYQSLWLFLYAQYAHIMFEIVPIALITNIVISIMASLLFINSVKRIAKTIAQTIHYWNSREPPSILYV